MKKITLGADAQLIKVAKKQADLATKTIKELRAKYAANGRKITREEMNERR